MNRLWHSALALAALPLALLGAPLAAAAATGIFGLDEVAIPVSKPGGVYLDALACAGARLVAVGEHGVISYSDDRGETWIQARVPVDVTLTAVAFATSLSGWAAGSSGVILHTGDGGKTWQVQLNGLQANQLTMESAKLVNKQNSQSPGAANALHRAGVFLSQGADRPFLSILINNPQQVTVFGAYRMTMRTDDGGRSWTDWSLNIGDALSHNLYGATQAGSDAYVVGEAGLVFHSTDGGASFPAVSSPTDATLFGVLATGDGVLVYGLAGLAYKSTDQGKSWTKIAVASSANLTAAITLHSGAILLASETGDLFISHDHGSSFKSLSKGLPMAVFDIKQTSDDQIVAVGNSGAMTLPPAFLAGY